MQPTSPDGGACPPGSRGCSVGGADLYRTVVSGAPGGALLGVWGDAEGRAFYLVGGYAGVDPALVTDGRIGRLVRFEGATLTTLCTTDAVLWGVHGARDNDGSTVVYAVGGGGRVVRYRGGRCETLTFDATFPEGVPTLRGVHAVGADDVWIVGGASQAAGPHGVLVHYDGARFAQSPDVPAAARGSDLNAISQHPGSAALVVVGSGGTLLVRQDAVWTGASGYGGASSLAGVSCGSIGAGVAPGCVAVGALSSGLFFLSPDGTRNWSTVDLRLVPPGLNGAWIDGQIGVFVVGENGFSMHTNTRSNYVAPRMSDGVGLRGVSGIRATPRTSAIVVAVGGDLGVTDATQSGVVLMRGDLVTTTFTFDGQSYTATGSLRVTLGASGGQ